MKIERKGLNTTLMKERLFEKYNSRRFQKVSDQVLTARLNQIEDLSELLLQYHIILSDM